MSSPLDKPIDQMRGQIAALMPQLSRQVGATVLYFINENFQKQGFQGESFEPWDKRNPDRDPGRPVLTGKGTAHLKKSPFDSYPDDHTVKITSNLPYSQIHNEGGTITIPERETILNFDRTPEHGPWRFGKVRTINQQRGIKAIRRAHVGAFTIHMPKRQYMGPSPVLDKRIAQIIDNALNKLK